MTYIKNSPISSTKNFVSGGGVTQPKNIDDNGTVNSLMIFVPLSSFLLPFRLRGGN